MEILITSASQPISFDGVIRGVDIVKHPCHRPGTRIGTSFIQDETSGSVSQFSLTDLIPTNPNGLGRLKARNRIKLCLIRFGGLALGQIATDEKSNEITAMPNF